MVAIDAKKIRQLLDKEAIREAALRYTRGVDRHAIQGNRSCDPKPSHEAPTLPQNDSAHLSQQQSEFLQAVATHLKITNNNAYRSSSAHGGQEDGPIFLGKPCPEISWGKEFSWETMRIAYGAYWEGPFSQTYYSGRLEPLNYDRKLDVMPTLALSRPVKVSFVSSTNGFIFERSLAHIRTNNEDLIELRYVLAGTFVCTQMNRSFPIYPGQFFFTRSNVPSRFECIVDSKMPFEYLSLLMQSSTAYAYFPEGIPLTTCFSSQPNRHLAMPKILSLLYDEGHYLNVESVNDLVGVVMREARLLAQQQGQLLVDYRKTISEKRIEDIIAYIQLHFGNPDLSLTAVANGCEISPRHLCKLLKLQGRTFSDVLWTERLKTARNWLVSLNPKRYSISAIAYMAGFKTLPHFSRMFHDYYGCSPRAFRNQQFDS